MKAQFTSLFFFLFFNYKQTTDPSLLTQDEREREREREREIEGERERER